MGVAEKMREDQTGLSGGKKKKKEEKVFSASADAVRPLKGSMHSKIQTGQTGNKSQKTLL